MRAAVLLSCLAACAFVPSGEAPTGDGDATPFDATDPDARADAPPIDAAVDAPIDAVDARICPAPPTGCTAIACAASPGCRYLCTAGLSFSAANARCMSAGLGCLAIIDDAVENACIYDAVMPMFPNMLWIGFSQASGSAEPGGGWGWVCGGTSGYLAGNWNQPGGEPNDQGGNEDCALMNTGGAWIDGDCSRSFRFVCELP